MLGLLGVLTAAVVSAIYFVSVAFLSYAWSNGDDRRRQRLHISFIIAYLVVATGLYLVTR